MSSHNKLQSPAKIMDIVYKLPNRLRERWRRRSYTFQRSYGGVYVKNLVDFVAEELEVIKQPVFGKINDSSDIKRKFDRPTKTNRVLASKIEDSSEKRAPNRYCEYYKMTNHSISSCNFFKEISAPDKSLFVKKTRLCFGCLLKNHMSKFCTKKLVCAICSLPHPTILHDSNKEAKHNEVQETLSSSYVCENSENSPVCSATNYDGTRKKKVIYPCVPVRAKTTHNSKDVIVNCAIDNCSSDSWISENLLKKLNVRT